VAQEINHAPLPRGAEKGAWEGRLVMRGLDEQSESVVAGEDD